MFGPRLLNRHTQSPFPTPGAIVDPVERHLGGVVAGVLGLLGGLLLALLPVVPAFRLENETLVIALAAGSLLWGAVSIWVIDWVTASSIMRHATALGALAMAGVAVWASGGGTSPLGAFITFLALFGCYFYVAPVAIVYLLLCMVVQALPVIYDPGPALLGGFLIPLLIFAGGEAAIGGALIAGKALHTGRRRKAEVDAFTDSLTGLANHRVLAQRLAEEIRTVTQTGKVLSVVVLDIDHFKQINDTGGHAEGDRALVFVARCLSVVARSEDVLTRSGGDEFTWLMPGITAAHARDRLEQARALVQVDRAPALTISAGVCDSTQVADPSRLVQLADGALYWSKAHGRARSQIYDPAVVDALSADERADKLERSQALTGLRALARATDAKAPETRGHSERVANIAARMAQAAGWDDQRTALLREAATLHDVGKIGIDDGVLSKPEKLTDMEYEQIKDHPVLSARIVEGILRPEQVGWIRAIHERPDGGGYPFGLHGEAIPDGAHLLAVANTYDVITVGSSYKVGRTQDHALAECRAGIGTQFSAVAVAALEGAVGARPAIGALDLVVWRHGADDGAAQPQPDMANG